jgi:GT2 family glycosyltransferase
VSSHPKLSIVIPCRTRTDLLATCLQSIQTHKPQFAFDVIVIDDGSRNALVSLVAQSFPVRCYRQNRARGFASAANAGLRMALAPIVQFLNDDAEVTAGWAEPAIAAFDDPPVASVAPLVLRWPGNVIDSAGDDYDAGGFAQPRGRGQHATSAYSRSRSVDGASACGAFFRRDVVLRLGGFAESFGAYFEDVDLSCRVRRAGFDIRYVPESRILHRGSASYGPPRGRLLEQQSCNEERLFWRNVRHPVHLVRHAAVVGAKAMRRWHEGRLTPWLCGRLRALAMMPFDITGRSS